MSLRDAIAAAQTPADALSLRLSGVMAQRDVLQWRLYLTRRALETAAATLAVDGCCPMTCSDWDGCELTPDGTDICSDAKSRKCWIAYLLDMAEQAAKQSGGGTDEEH
jgi:hypothetical protein